MLKENKRNWSDYKLLSTPGKYFANCLRFSSADVRFI